MTQNDRQETVTDRPRGSRKEYEQTDMECPQGCAETAPAWRGMERVTHHTGEYDPMEIYGEGDMIERTETYLKCPRCGWIIDI